MIQQMRGLSSYSSPQHFNDPGMGREKREEEEEKEEEEEEERKEEKRR